MQSPTGLGRPTLPAPLLAALFVFVNDFIIPSQQEPAFISISLVAWQTKRDCGGGTEPGRQAGRQSELQPQRHLSICVALSQRMGLLSSLWCEMITTLVPFWKTHSCPSQDITCASPHYHRHLQHLKTVLISPLSNGA